LSKGGKTKFLEAKKSAEKKGSIHYRGGCGTAMIQNSISKKKPKDGDCVFFN
jgi:hypothetical protein